MLYDVVILNRESSLRTSQIGCEKAITFSPHDRLDFAFRQTFGGLTEEPLIGIGASLETRDPSINLSPVIAKGLGQVHSTTDGLVFYEILFYQMGSGFYPYKLIYRTEKNPIPEELVNYKSCEEIYPDIKGIPTHIVDPRVEVLGSYLSDEVYGTGQGLIDIASDTLQHHPLFGSWARHSLSASVVSDDVKKIMSQVQLSAHTGRIDLHPNALSNMILPLDMPSTLGRIVRCLTPSPNTWLMGTSRPISFVSTPTIPTCSDVTLNPISCMSVADVLSTLSATDISVMIRCVYGSLATEISLISYIHRYASCMSVSQASISRDVALLNQLCPYVLLSYMEKRGYDHKKPLYIGIEKTFNEEAMISFSYDGTDVFHQVYLDLALLSLCSMGVSVIG